MSNQPDVSFDLGDVLFVTRGSDASAGHDALSELPLYRAFAKKGFISISRERDFTKNFNWVDYAQQTRYGAQRFANVAATDAGRAAGKIVKAGERELLAFTVCKSTIEKIVANDPLLKGTDRYRIVMATFSFTVPEDLVSVLVEARGPSYAKYNERRLRALLKYDPFDKKWKYVTGDAGPRDGDYWGRSVDDYLKEH